ncbi:hypothetical protein AcW1_008784 [Taiwanofungus camphoratus]|nr:hypothetical protein AcV5_006816 [Antrodia cinnamomea]KAI0949083.1 hypothetical protein AcW1_008784 [Antrodia cinnamomea]
MSPDGISSVLCIPQARFGVSFHSAGLCIYPQVYHPRLTMMKRDLSSKARHYTRTERPTKHYYIDFSHAWRYNPEDGPPRELPLLGGDKTVPEFQNDGYNVPSDPFPTDIYYVGNVIHQRVLQKYYGLEFINTLVAIWYKTTHRKRPTIEQVISQFHEIHSKLSLWKLHSRLVGNNEHIIVRVFKGTGHVFRTAGYVVRRLPPVSTPSTKS